MEWLIAAGLHPRANATTLAIAQDLGARMDYTTGHARYCLEETASRLRVDKSTVKRHVAFLRELGALAWVVHGTKTNVRRALGMSGYAATATVYAATIPAAYDRAMGRTVIGTGYNARVVTDMRGTQTTPATAPEPVDNSPVDNPGSGSCAPPSLTMVKESGSVQVESGFNYTSRKCASRRTDSAPRTKTSSNSQTPRRSPLQVAQDIRIARRVRALVNWTQTEKLRRLGFVLRPFIDRGLDGDQIAAELSGMCLGWRPKQPANYIRTALAEQASVAAQLAADEERRTSSTWQDRASLAKLLTVSESTEPERTDEDRLRARLDWNAWPDVAAHYADDPDDAIDLYGERLVIHAIRKDAQFTARKEASYV
ncbi:cell wall protein [Streptomyces sp. NPDC060366]|uniref:cell wall protein n=1 Tax=Streptomyces sp. NPDC060366 TaxID=3347105 RepID=UPI0036510B51